MAQARPMPVEIERRFLVVGDGWREQAAEGQRYCQGLVARNDRGKVRIRRAGPVAFVTIKSARRGLVRDEYEYEIPVEEAEELLRNVCVRPLLEKTRHELVLGGLTWEIDVLHGVPGEDGSSDLVLAEVELDRPDQAFAKPGWIGREVTQDPRFRNEELVKRKRADRAA